MSCCRELGQLLDRIDEFEKRGVTLWAVVAAPVEDAADLAEQFPGITFLADPDLSIVNAFAVAHRGGAFPVVANDQVVAYPTSFLIDETGTIRWVYRSARIMERAGVDVMLAAIDAERSGS